jgi:hypothetical protein
MSQRKSKRRAQDDFQAQSTKRIAPPRNSSTIHHIDARGSVTQITSSISTKALPDIIPLASPTLQEADLDDSSDLGEEHDDEIAEEHVGEYKTQVRMLLSTQSILAHLRKTRMAIDELLKHEYILQNGIFQHYENPFAKELCLCGSKKMRHISCFECFQHPARCTSCFVNAHQHSPLHWAHVWDVEDRCFKKHDYASLSDSLFVQLGHDGDSAACRGGTTPILFTIVHTNGVHGTRLRFCACPGSPTKITQLTQARLFPATTVDPHTAFTFDVLTEFHHLNMQSKCSAFDYMHSLKRLTDDMFSERTLVSSALLQFPPNLLVAFSIHTKLSSG